MSTLESTIETPVEAEVCDDSNTLVMENGFTITWMLVTPACAEAFLTHNIHNRPLRPNKIAAYVRDIKAGSWRRSPQPIMFDQAGNLIDGQHRLYAIVRANLAVWVLVIRGVDDDVQEVIDTQGIRKGSDALYLSERVEENHPSIASVGRSHILWAEGHLPHHQWRPNVNASRTVTNSEITEWFDAQKALGADEVNVIHAVTMAREEWSHTTRYLTTPVLALAYMLLAEKDREQAESFLTSLNNSEFGFGDLDPVAQLQARLILARKDKESLRLGQYLYLIFTAFNAYCADEELSERFIADISKAPDRHVAVNPKIARDRKTGVPTFPAVPALV